MAASGPEQLLQYQPVLDGQGLPVKLGSGAYSSVYRYKDVRNGQSVAIKRVRLRDHTPLNAQLLMKYLPSELQNHHMLHHPHVVKLKDVFLTDDHLNLVLELADGGTLFQRVYEVTTTGGHMDEQEARWLFQQLVLTMDYFHCKNVSHRDIKLENALLQDVGNMPVVKVADFGFSKYDATLTYTCVGTIKYMSPEVVKALRIDGTGLGLGYNPMMADIWSTGVMLYAMVAGTFPFDATLPDLELLRQMTRRPLQLPKHVSADCRQLLEALLHPNPEERITIAAIKQNSWFMQDLPPGALTMTEQCMNAPSPCLRSRQELQGVIAEAIQRLERQAAAVDLVGL